MITEITDRIESGEVSEDRFPVRCDICGERLETPGDSIDHLDNQHQGLISKLIKLAVVERTYPISENNESETRNAT